MQKLIKILIYLLLAFNFLYSQDKNSVFNSLVKEFKDINSIYIEYKSLDIPNLSGSILAKKGNYYKITTNDRLIVCDSKTIWNYSLIDKNVIISNVKNLSSASLENVFFQLIDNYEPTDLNKVTNSKGLTFFELYLKSKDNSTTTFDKIILILNSKNKIEEIKLYEKFRNTNIKIEQINLNVKTDDNTFKFEVNEKMEIIDLR